jgi:hypothetical protein
VNNNLTQNPIAMYILSRFSCFSFLVSDFTSKLNKLSIIVNTIQIDWSKGEPSGLVDIGTHKLCLYSHGPDRKLRKPVVIYMSYGTSN